MVGYPCPVVLLEHQFDLPGIDKFEEILLDQRDGVAYLRVVHFEDVGILVPHREYASGRDPHYGKPLGDSLLENGDVVPGVPCGACPEAVGDHGDTAALLVQ